MSDRKQAMIVTLAIRNPRVIEATISEKELGTGRNPVETAENLILEAVEARRIRRAIESASSASRPMSDGNLVTA